MSLSTCLKSVMSSSCSCSSSSSSFALSFTLPLFPFWACVCPRTQLRPCKSCTCRPNRTVAGQKLVAPQLRMHSRGNHTSITIYHSRAVSTQIGWESTILICPITGVQFTTCLSPVFTLYNTPPSISPDYLFHA